MQPPNGSGGHRQRMIVLDEGNGDAVLGQGLGAIAFREKTTMIAKTGRRYQHQTRQRGMFNLHSESLMSKSLSSLTS